MFQMLLFTFNVPVFWTVERSPHASSSSVFVSCRQVARTIGLREIWYFGLQFVDNRGLVSWLLEDKKVGFVLPDFF